MKANVTSPETLAAGELRAIDAYWNLADNERPPERLRRPAAARTPDAAGDAFNDVGSGRLLVVVTGYEVSE